MYYYIYLFINYWICLFYNSKEKDGESNDKKEEKVKDESESSKVYSFLC
jgi:hypothetical protein